MTAAAVSPETGRVDDTRDVRNTMITGPLLRPMLAMALPTTLVLIAQASVGVAETWYVSFLGKHALAGVSLVFPVQMLMTMMSNGGIGSGVASAVARAVGAGRLDDANALVRQTVVLGSILGFGFMVLGWAIAPLLYRSLGGSGPSLDAAIAYSNAVFAGSVPFWVVNLLAAALRGAGNVRVPAKVTLVGALIVVALSPAFVFGIGPLPALGIAGAGFAVSLYYAGAAVWMIRYLGSGESPLRLSRGPLEYRHLADIVRVGLPTAVSAIQPNVTALVLTASVGLFGIDALAGYGIASRLDYLLIPILFGLASAVLTMVGTNVGAGELERARRIAWVGACVGFVVAGVIGLAATLAPSAWLSTFSHDDAVLAPGRDYLRLVAPTYGIFGAGFVLAFAAQGAAKMLWPFLAGTARMILAAGGGWLLVSRGVIGLSGLFVIVAASMVLYAVVTGLAVLGGDTLRKRKAPN